jgi:hypothetical protein
MINSTKNSLFYLFLKFVQINYIFIAIVRILYLCYNVKVRNSRNKRCFCRFKGVLYHIRAFTVTVSFRSFYNNNINQVPKKLYFLAETVQKIIQSVQYKVIFLVSII